MHLLVDLGQYLINRVQNSAKNKKILTSNVLAQSRTDFFFFVLPCWIELGSIKTEFQLMSMDSFMGDFISLSIPVTVEEEKKKKKITHFFFFFYLNRKTQTVKKHLKGTKPPPHFTGKKKQFWLELS